jgi:hypothetical protein
MKKALECGGGFFPPDAKPSEVLQPGNGALDGPSSLISPKAASILRCILGSAIASMRSDQFDALLSQGPIQSVAVISLVADHSLRVL